jgi:hypothetical protein
VYLPPAGEPAQIYDPSSDTWAPGGGASLLANDVLGQLGDGRIVLSGSGGTFLFDPMTLAYQQICDPPADGVGVTLADGRMLVVPYEGEAAIYDPAGFDPDGDCDAVDDTVDNCPGATNPGQYNADGERTDLGTARSFDDLTWPNSDAPGDACDADPDNDGQMAGTPCDTGAGDAAPLLRDADGDLVLDGAECELDTDPGDIDDRPAALVGLDLDFDGVPSRVDPNDGDADSDDDGVLDGQEFRYYHTNLANADTDGDGCSDAREIASINGDRRVDVIDLQQVATAFGPYALPGQPDHVAFDVVKNGDINVIDLQFVAARGGACPRV